MTTLLEMREITKIFPGVKALDRVSLTVEAGEIHADEGAVRRLPAWHL